MAADAGAGEDAHYFDLPAPPVMCIACDLDTEISKAFAERWGWQTTEASWQKVVERDDIDLIDICTPNIMHAPIAVAAAKAGKHVICEKPLEITPERIDQMIAACDGAGVTLSGIFNRRFHPAMDVFKQAVDEGRFGRLTMCDAYIKWYRDQAYYDSGAWRGTWEFDGGALMNQASHYVDLLDWLIGPIESLQAYTGTLARDIQVEDTATMSVRWRSGAIGSMNVTMLTYPKNLEGSITAVTINRSPAGENGPLVYELFPDGYEPGAFDWLTSWNYDDWDDLDVGHLYVLVLTDAYPEGEIRGQLLWVPTPVAGETTWGRIRALWEE